MEIIPCLQRNTNKRRNHLNKQQITMIKPLKNTKAAIMKKAHITRKLLQVIKKMVKTQCVVQNKNTLKNTAPNSVVDLIPAGSSGGDLIPLTYCNLTLFTSLAL